MNNFIKLAIIRLHQVSTQEQDVIKIAGLIQKIQHWFKKLTNPAYKQQVLEMETNSKEIQEILSLLDQEFSKIREAIKLGDSETYSLSLSEIKNLTGQFLNQIKEVNDQGKLVENILQGYGIKEFNHPDFKQTFKKHLPSDYDLELDVPYRIPAIKPEFNKNLSSSSISIPAGTSPNPLEILTKTLIRKLVREYNLEESSVLESFQGSNLEQFLQNFKEAIVHGTLLRTSPKKPGPGMKSLDWGLTEIEIITDQYQIPQLPFKIMSNVLLADYRTARSGSTKDKLVVIATKKHRIEKIITASRLKELQKIALLQEIQAAPVVKTPTVLNEVELAQTLRKAYQKTFGQDPSLQTLAGGWAQVAFENGRGQKIYNNNFGNMKATPEWLKDPHHLYYVNTTKEFTKKGKSYLDKNAKWRAYSDPIDGAIAYWKLLGKNYADSLKWMAAGDPESAVTTLANKTYFTDNPKHYSSQISSLYQEFIKKIAPQLPNLKSAVLILQEPKPRLNSEINWNEKKNESNSEVDELGNILYNTANFNPLTNIVKKAWMKQNLPFSNYVVLLNSNQHDNIAKIEYAKIATEILKDHLEIDSDVFKNDEKVEIQCQAYGSPLLLTKVIQKVCDCLTTKLLLSTKNNIKVEAIVVPGFISYLKKISKEELQMNRRAFYLKKFSKFS